MIFLTRVTQPERGAIVAMYCKQCHRTEITLNEHAAKPNDGGDMWIVNLPCSEHRFITKDWYELKWPNSRGL